MAVKIRLVRIGAKGRPSYRVVAADERKARGGSNIEILGSYDPLVEPSAFNVDREKVLAWLKKGAQPTETVRKLLGKAGILKAVDFTNYKKKAPRQKGEAEQKPAGTPAAAPAAPAEQAKA